MLISYQDPSGKDFTLSDICSLIERDYEYEVFVGTDSQVHRKKRKVLYVTCIVLYKKSKGGKIFMHKEWESVPPKAKKGTPEALQFLRQRLSNEVYRSVQTSLDLQNLLPSNAEIVIDVDLNKNPKYRSSNYLQELVGMVTGQGFRCRAKPNAWASTNVANRFSK